MKTENLAHWLLENGGPAILYRTETELIDDTGADAGSADASDVDTARLVSDLLASPTTQLWLERLGTPDGGLAGFHLSKPQAFENAASKLCDLGLHVGMEPLDVRMAPFRQWLDEQAQAIEKIAEVNYNDVDTKEATQSALDHGIRWFEAMIVTARLAWMGYADAAIRVCLSRRLETLYALAQTGNHAIYIDQDTFGDYPNNPFRKRHFIDPQFNAILPSIHDIYALAHYPKDILDETAQHKIDAVVAYILHPDYQALEDGYGVMRAGPRRYFSMGWSIHLPGYYGFDFDAGQAGMFVQRLELMAHFPAAIAHRWFQESLAHLESFRSDEDPYRFPAHYLKESPAGYWVSGAYMRLEENRRTRESLALDSTFRALLLKKLAGAVR
jgi:hypothetical protein